MSREPSDYDDRTDPFAPPAIPVEVGCLHCQQTYESWQIEWREREGGPSADRNGRGEGDWCCPTPGCDGVGFCFDIWPTDPEWRDENGEQVWVSDDDDAAEYSDGYDDGDDPDDGYYVSDREDWDETDEAFDWVPVDRPMSPEDLEAFNRAWENMTGDAPGEERGYDTFDEDDIPF